jgi:hypothetical protein
MFVLITERRKAPAHALHTAPLRPLHIKNHGCGPAGRSQKNARTPQVQREHHLPAGDFPHLERFRDILSAFDLR